MSQRLRYEFLIVIDPETILSDGKVFSDLQELQLTRNISNVPADFERLYLTTGKINGAARCYR